MNNIQILVTGGAGYIGSVCVRMLLEEGYKVIILDNLSTGHSESVDPQAFFIEGSIGNKRLLNKIFQQYSISTVIHFAAETLVGHANTRPDLYYKNNIVNGLVLLDVMLQNNCSQIIFSSSAAVYGEPQYTPIDESHPTNPLNAYGFTKLAYENILKHYSQAFGIKFTAFRYFNPGGSYKSLGERHSPETHLIPLILEVAMKKRKYIELFGDDYDTDDGTCIRDYLHVSDVAKAHLLAIKKPANRIFNLGTEKGSSVKQVINMAEIVTGQKIPYLVKSRRPGDPSRLVATSAKARSELGWKPTSSGLSEIISSSWKFQNRNIHVQNNRII